MPNPSFMPAVWTADATYTVSATEFLALDIRLDDIDNAPASVILTVPAGGEVHALRNPADWSGTGTALLTAGAWAAGPVTLGDWTITVTAGAAATDPSVISVSNGSGQAPTGIFRLLLTGLGGAATVIEPSGGTLSIDRLLADPAITSTYVSAPPLPITEGTTGITLAASTDPSERINPVPATPLIPAPTLHHAWTEDPNNTLAVKNFTPGGVSATLDAPAVYQDTTVNFVLTVTYDMNNSGTVDPGEPANTATLAVTIETVVYGMVLVVDRSGSMGGALGTGNKWERAVNSAHAWMDLFRAFRTGGNHRAGVLTFQNDACAWSQTPDTQLPFLDPSDGSALADPDPDLLKSLDFFEEVDSWNLGNVASCTPIGDGLIRAWEAIAAAQSNVESGAVILVTDGYENSGEVTIEATTANGGMQTFEAARGAVSLAGANDKIGPRVFALGVGSMVQSDRLQVLASGGHYAQINDAANLLNALAEMLGAVLASERASPLIGVVDPAPVANALYYPANAGEQVLALLLPLPNPGDTISVAWRPQGGGNFIPINPTDTHLTLLERTSHVLLRVDLMNLPQPTPTGSEWRVQRLNGGAAQPLTDADVLAMTDLFVQTEMSFGRQNHFIEEPVELFCKISAGGQPVTGAEVLVDVARPGESLGTFLATNANAYKPGGDDVRRGPDPATGKAHMLQTLLRANQMPDLPIVQQPDFKLLDDGAHGDGPAGNGIYANSFNDTAKEGTYTFRFRVSGTLPNGSRFARTILKSIYLSDKASISTSVFVWQTLPEPSDGQIVSLLTFTPKSAGGEFLGPFRQDAIALTVADGSLDGALVDNLDGSYSQRVLHTPDVVPIVSVGIYGTPLKPTGPGLDCGGGDGRGCWKRWLAALHCTWRAILRFFGIQ